MFIIEGVLIYPEVFSTKFICNLKKCKGACCWEGDFGAPVTEEEVQQMEKDYAQIDSLLSQQSKNVLQEEGLASYNPIYKGIVTPLLPDGSCAYLVKNEEGIAQCGWEMAYTKGQTQFKKPMSCHLYPIRVKEDKQLGTQQLTYDEWDICSAACSLGEENNMPVFRFLKDPIIRKYGEEFFQQMEDIYISFFQK